MNPTLLELLDANAEHAAGDESRFDGVLDGQSPEAVTVCCSDSRVLQDGMWGNDEPGRLFTCANIGNRVVQRRTDADGEGGGDAHGYGDGDGEGAGDGLTVSGDVLFPLVNTGTELAIVVGHTGCGAVTAAYDDLTDGLDEPPGITSCLALLESGLADVVRALPDDLDRVEAINRLVEYNVDRQVDRLLESDDVPDGVDVVGVVYDFQDVYGGRRGELHVVNVAGETDTRTLRDSYPEVADRVTRLTD